MLRQLYFSGNKKRCFYWALAIVVSTYPIASDATVIEFSDDGSPTIQSKVQPKVENKDSQIESSIDKNLKPRKLSKLDNRQLLYRKLASDTALRYAGADGVKIAGIDALTFVDVFTSLIHRESNYDPEAVSSKGAKGLGQLRDETASDLGVKNPFDPRQNLDGSARYLTQMLKRFGSLELALAAYNAGPSRVEKYNGVPPFQETRQYVIDIFYAVGIETDLASADVGQKTTIKQDKNNIENHNSGEQSVWEY